MFRSSATSLLWRGLLGLAIGVIAIAWPGVTVGAVVFIFAIAWPGITAEVLTIWIGIWAFVTGAGELAMAFTSGGTTASRFMLGLTGLLSVALGVVLVVRPEVGTVSLAQVFGLFSFAYGIANLILALSVRESTAPQEATT